MNSTKWTSSLLLLVGISIGWPASKADTLPTNLELVYEVSFGVAELGSLSSTLKKQTNHYEVTSETRAEGMASILLGGTVREMCQFSIDNNAIKPAHYRIVREGRDAFDYSVSFNWDERRVKFSDGSDVVISDGYIVDNCSVPFAFIIGGPATFKQKTLHIVGGKKVRRFENSLIENEQVSTPLGKFDAVKIEQVRFDRPDRKLTIWLALNRSNLPIKIVEQRKSRPDTTMLLKSVEGL